MFAKLLAIVACVLIGANFEPGTIIPAILFFGIMHTETNAEWINASQQEKGYYVAGLFVKAFAVLIAFIICCAIIALIGGSFS